AALDSQESKRSNREFSVAVAAEQRSGSGNHGQPAGTTQISFVDVAAERGLNHVWPEQPRPMTALDAFGSGCATFDGDNDGSLDVLLICDHHPKLFRNVGEGNFQDVTSLSGLTAESGDWGGCAVGDYNGDGLLDILLTGYHRLALYKNVGQLRFQ